MAKLSELARDAQVKFCLKSGGSFEEEFARAIERAHGIGAAPAAPTQERGVQAEPLTDAQIEQGRKDTFSTDNPFCPCDSKTMRKAVRWAEHAHGIGRRSAAPQAEPLTDEQRLHLGQAADLLDEYGNECSRGGTDSTAKGCEASAYVLRQILRAAPAAPAQEPQQPDGGISAAREQVLSELHALLRDKPHATALTALIALTPSAPLTKSDIEWAERIATSQHPAASSPAPAVPDDPEQHPDFYAWTWDVWVSGGRWRSDFGWKRPSGTVPARNIKAVYTRPAPSPAPAVQPLTMGRIYEAWHEIGADVAGLSWAKFAEALSGQPQGGQG